MSQASAEREDVLVGWRGGAWAEETLVVVSEQEGEAGCDFGLSWAQSISLPLSSLPLVATRTGHKKSGRSCSVGSALARFAPASDARTKRVAADGAVTRCGRRHRCDEEDPCNVG